MPGNLPDIRATVDRGLAAQAAELTNTRARQLVAVRSQTETGSGDIDATVELDCKFRLVFIRCHFVGTAGTAEFTVSADSASGSAYDARLFAIAQAGTSRDVHLRIGDGDLQEPSPWVFQSGDSVRIQWTNPDSGNITWGLEVGLALAS